MLMIDQTLEVYLENAKTPDPNPGGGSVAAYVGALGAALNIMVAELSYGKKDYEAKSPEIKAEIETGVRELDRIINELKPLVDEDSKSFDAVLDAFKLPKNTDEEKRVRSEQIQAGYIHALKVPLGTAKLCIEAMELLDVFAKHGGMHAITDVGCGVLMLATAAEGALFNVLINVKSVKDADQQAHYRHEAESIREHARNLRDTYLRTVYARLENE